MRALFLVVGLFGCGSAEAPPPPPVEEPVGTPTGTVDVVESKAPVLQGVSQEQLGELFGDVGQAEAPMGLGMRGEGVQNGGPKYPGIGDIAAKKPLGYGSYGSVPAAAMQGPEAKPTVEVAIRATVSKGPFDATELENYVTGHVSQLRYCYARAKLKHPDLATHSLTLRVKLHWEAPDTAELVTTDFPATDPSVPTCVLSGAGRWAWPSHRRDAEADLLLRFTPT